MHVKNHGAYKNKLHLSNKRRMLTLDREDSFPRNGPSIDHFPKKYPPEIAHELSELYRLFSNQKQSLLSSRFLSATPKQTTRDQIVRYLPAPARFTRKTKPGATTRAVCPTGPACPSESSHWSSQQSCKTSATLSDNAYDRLLQKLMSPDGLDCYALDESMMGNLDTQLNEAS